MPKMPMPRGGMTTVNRFIKRDEQKQIKKSDKDEFNEWYANLSEKEKAELDEKEEEDGTSRTERH